LLLFVEAGFAAVIRAAATLSHQWDDPKDFSMWRNALKALKP
jgi:hypothetical protein